MYCPKCGAKATDGAKFCSECGAPLVVAPNVESPTEISEVEVAPTQDPTEKPSVLDSAKSALGQAWSHARENAQAKRVAEQAEMLREAQRLEQLDREGIAYCPKCHSTSLSANKKGFSFGKAVAGTVLSLGTPIIGLAAGGIGSGKVKVTCLKCGHQFTPGKHR